MIVRPGRMRDYITIQTLNDVQDAQGGKSETWTTFTESWAGIRPLRGTEYLAASQLQARVTHEIKVRWIAGITPKMRVSLGSRVFRIQSAINEDERDMILTLMCEEVL